MRTPANRLRMPLTLGGAAILLTVILIWRPFSKTEIESIPPPAAQTTERSPTVRDPATRQDKVARAVDASGGEDWPSDPETAVANIRKEFSGQKLDLELQRAAKHYMEEGLESGKAFILALPAGEIGRRSLVSAARFSIPYAPQFVAFLKQNETELTPNWVSAALRGLQLSWRTRDMDAAREYFMTSPVLTYDERLKHVSQMLNMPLPQWGGPADVLKVIREMPEGEMKDDLLVSQGYFRARIKSDNLPTLQVEFDRLKELSDAERAPVMQTLADAFRYVDDPGPALELLGSSNVGGAEAVLLSSYGRWISEDLNTALTSLGKLSSGSARDQIIANNWKTIAEYDVRSARQWIESIGSDQLRRDALAASDHILNSKNE